MSKAISVVIVDDHAMFRIGVAQTLAMQGSFKVAGEGTSKAEAIELAEKLRPTIILLDISMPGNGIAAAREIYTRWPEIKIVMLTVSESNDDVLQALEAGAAAFVLKGVAASELTGILSAVAKGDTYLSAPLSAQLFRGIRAQSQALETASPELSAREREIMRLLAKGLSNGAIAEMTGIRLRTVKFHVSSIFGKLNVNNRVEAAVKAQNLLNR